jgi:hypothetical protein
MSNDIAIEDEVPFLGADWFDPLEAGVRQQIRSFMEEMLESELALALGRARHHRSAVGHPDGHRIVSFSAVRAGERLGATGWPAANVTESAVESGFSGPCSRQAARPRAKSSVPFGGQGSTARVRLITTAGVPPEAKTGLRQTAFATVDLPTIAPPADRT